MTQEITEQITAMAARAKEAQHELAGASRDRKDSTLLALGEAISDQRHWILEKNAEDISRGEDNGTSAAMLDRLRLTDERIDGLRQALAELAALPDPVGQVIRGQRLPNGIRLQQMRVPMGVVGVIYEARPNVTVDISGIALKAGSAVLLRGGSAAQETNAATVQIMRDALRDQGFSPNLIQTIDPFGRPGADVLMSLRGAVDVLIPRGGAGLIQHVVQNSQVPVIETGEGNVHVYVDASADVRMATRIVHNAKTHRTSVCNAAETLLIHRDAEDAGTEALRSLAKAGVEIHADPTAKQWLLNADADSVVLDATETDWGTEYLDMAMAVRVVDSLDEAIQHINSFSTKHTEVIVTNDLGNAERFINDVDAAVVMVNASSRFTDGGQFGLGAEIGISTQKMHARGPMGLDELTTTKWVLRGDGQVRS